MKKEHINEREAFTLIELIVVIVVIAILAGAAKMAMPDNTLYSDTDFIRQQIRKTQMRALLTDHYDFNDPSWRTRSYDDTCIELTKSALQALEEATNQARKYKLHPQTTLQIDSADEKICFDVTGRPYRQDYRLNNFLKKPIELNINYKNQHRTLIIMPYSGGVMIKR